MRAAPALQNVPSEILQVFGFGFIWHKIVYRVTVAAKTTLATEAFYSEEHSNNCDNIQLTSTHYFEPL